MKWTETVASQCRYGDVIGEVFSDAEVIWENSYADYQGSANILVKMFDGRFAHYSWTYGSCSGCDEWEAANYNDEQIRQEVLRTTAWLANEEQLIKYLKLEEEYKDALLPTANSITNGSIPGMLKYLCGGWASDFEDMRKAAIDWLNLNKK